MGGTPLENNFDLPECHWPHKVREQGELPKIVFEWDAFML